MVISISGASSTGKTTLFNKLKELFPQYNYIEETYRKAVNNKQINLDDPEEAFLFQYELGNDLKLPIFNINQIYILDRCSFDNIIYLSLHFLRLDDELKKKYLFKYTESILYSRSLIMNIDYIFLTQGDNEIEDDNIRPGIYNDFRDQELSLFKTLIKTIHKSYLILPNNINDRVQMIIDYIRE